MRGIERPQAQRGSQRILILDLPADFIHTEVSQLPPIEGRRTRQQFVQHDAETVDVSARIDVATRRRGRRERWNAFQLGWASGVFCVGCCWALMLLMLVSSVHHLALMLVLGLVMAVEKNVRWGRRLSAPLGVVLITGAVIAFLDGGEFQFLSKTLPDFCGMK